MIDLEASRSGGRPRELYRFAQGAQVWTFTGADAELAYVDGFYAQQAISHSEAEMSSEEQAGNITVTLPASNAAIRSFVSCPVAAPMSLLIRRLQPNGQVSVAFVGQVLKANFKDGAVELTCAPLASALSRMIPSVVFQRLCPWALYGPGCAVDRTLYRAAGLVSSHVGSEVRADFLALQADGWYTWGLIEVLDGPSTGDTRFIRSHTGAVITISAPIHGLGSWHNIAAYAGCARTEAVCEAKFGNLARHLGCPNIPLSNPYIGRMF